jgi:hypothetical protein
MCLILGLPLVKGQNTIFNFNFDNAIQTLDYLEQSNLSESEMMAFIKSKGTQAVIKKIKASDSLAVKALTHAQQNNFEKAERSFQYERVKKNHKEMKAFVELIMAKQDSIKQILNTTFAPFLEKDKTYTFNVYFLMGTYSMGFTFGESDAFYLGLHHYKYDLQSVIQTCKHELFHNIQNTYYNSEKTNTQLMKENKGAAYVHELLNYMFKEGSANYVEEYHLLKDKNTPHIKELKEHILVNENRISSLNYLVNRMVLDIYAHPNTINMDEAYTVLFDWSWNNVAYYMGEQMCLALSDAKGKAAMQAYLKKDAIYFVEDYIQLSKTNKEKYPIQFSDEFLMMIGKIKKKLKTK